MSNINVHRAQSFTCAAGVDNNDPIVTVPKADAIQYDTWILGATAGEMDVFVTLDGTNYLTTAIALIDLGSTTPNTTVVKTAAAGAYAFRGKYLGIRVDQNGASAVVNPALVGYRTT